MFIPRNDPSSGRIYFANLFGFGFYSPAYLYYYNPPIYYRYPVNRYPVVTGGGGLRAGRGQAPGLRPLPARPVPAPAAVGGSGIHFGAAGHRR